jgi:hypothetical protein
MVAQLHLLKPVKHFTLSLAVPALLSQAQRVMSMLQCCVYVCAMIIWSQLSPVMYCLSWIHLRIHFVLTDVGEKRGTLFDNDVFLKTLDGSQQMLCNVFDF